MPLFSPEDPTKFKAMVTQNQFQALAAKISINEIASHLRENELDRKQLDQNTLRKVEALLLNGWNTEHCINAILYKVTRPDLYNLIQWLFPQAYYTVSRVFCAYLYIEGQSPKDHTSLINTYSEFLISRKIPGLDYYVQGSGKSITPSKLSQSKPVSNLQYLGTNDDIDGHIASFLISTHKDKFNEKAKEARIREKKLRLNKQLLEAIAQKSGKTTIINLLYRKRIKSNYRDIDTYLHSELDAELIFRCIITIVVGLNTLIEGYIKKRLGDKIFNEIIARVPFSVNTIPKSRIL